MSRRAAATERRDKGRQRRKGPSSEQPAHQPAPASLVEPVPAPEAASSLEIAAEPAATSSAAEAVPAAEVQAEQVTAEQVTAEQVQAEQVQAEQVTAEQVTAEQVQAEQAAPEAPVSQVRSSEEPEEVEVQSPVNYDDEGLGEVEIDGQIYRFDSGKQGTALCLSARRDGAWRWSYLGELRWDGRDLRSRALDRSLLTRLSASLRSLAEQAI